MYTVNIKRKKIFVNGELTERIDQGSGGYRLIGLTSDGLIVKSDFTDKEGSFSCQTWAELIMLEHISKKDARYFPKIVASGTLVRDRKQYFWLIEKKANLQIRPRVTAKTATLVRGLFEKYGIKDVDTPFVGGRVTESANWGITPRGNPMIFDFGCNKYSPLK